MPATPASGLCLLGREPANGGRGTAEVLTLVFDAYMTGPPAHGDGLHCLTPKCHDAIGSTPKSSC